MTEERSTAVTISSDLGGTWALTAGPLPRLARCRARLVWRYAGETAWRDEFFPLPAAAGKAPRLKLQATAVGVALEAGEQANGGWEFGGHLTNTGNRPVELLRFHYLDGAIETSDAVTLLLLQQPQGSTACCVRPGQELPPIRPLQETSDCEWALPPRDQWLPDPIYDAPNWGCAVDSGVFFRKPGESGWVLGATGPGKAFGEIGLRSAGPDAGHFFAGQLLDNILLEPGATRELERLLILAGDWQTGLRDWAAACARALGSSPRKAQPLAGFCSWYRNFAEITPADIDRAIDEFTRMPVPPGGRMIQIDDGFQRACGDWGPNARFAPDWWATLPARIAASGSIPALWLAPLSVQDTNPIVKDHPEWFHRLPDGRFAVTMMNWGWCESSSWRFAEPGGSLAYNLNPDHPGARDFLRALLKRLVAEGWRAFKLDFNVSCPNTRVAYDRHKTLFETYRDQYRLFREAVGPDVLINACVGYPWRFTVGLADSCRIAGDMVGEWATMRTLLPGVLLRMMVTNGVWWSADPDVFYRRGGDSIITGSYFGAVTLSKSAEEQRLLLMVVGMMGGMLYTSDLPSEWSGEARREVLEFWGQDKPRPATNPRLVLDERTFLPHACRVDANGDVRSGVRCALFNLGDEPQAVSVTLAELGLAAPKRWRLRRADPGVTLREDGVLLSTQPPHSARVAFLDEVES